MSAGIVMPKAEPMTAAEPLLQPAAKAALRTNRLFRQIGQGLVFLALAVACYFFVSRFIVQNVTVRGVSMVPTLHNSQWCLLNRWILHFRSPKRAEIVVLRDPSDQGLAVKRIVGLPGDSVLVNDGVLYVNGHKLDEPYLPQGTRTFPLPHFRQQTFLCGSDQYFVLGDNRNNSTDSRTYGPILRRNILGLVIR